MEADIHPKATDYIDHIIEIIKKLDKQDAIYELEDGVYFDISKFSEYGKLSGQPRTLCGILDYCTRI